MRIPTIITDLYKRYIHPVTAQTVVSYAPPSIAVTFNADIFEHPYDQYMPFVPVLQNRRRLYPYIYPHLISTSYTTEYLNDRTERLNQSLGNPPLFGFGIDGGFLATRRGQSRMNLSNTETPFWQVLKTIDPTGQASIFTPPPTQCTWIHVEKGVDPLIADTKKKTPFEESDYERLEKIITAAQRNGFRTLRTESIKLSVGETFQSTADELGELLDQITHDHLQPKI